MERRSDNGARRFALLTVLAALLVLPTSALAARPKKAPIAPPPAAPAQATLVIASTTTGAQVELDGELVGVVPLPSGIAVEPGEHTIRLHLRGWSEVTDTFRAAPGEEVELELDLVPFAGIVRVTTAEPGASVAIDGKAVGATPFDQDVAIGEVTLTVSRPGYFDDVRQLDLQAGKTYDIAVQLRPLPPETPKVTQRWWFWTLIGVAVAGGATAAILATSSGGSGTPAPDAVVAIP